MRLLFTLSILVSTTAISSGQNAGTIYEDQGMRLLYSIDDMSDEATCTLVFEQSKFNVHIFGSGDFTVWAKEEIPDILRDIIGDPIVFAHDGEHLMRVGHNKPFRLLTHEKQNRLVPVDAALATDAVRAMVNGDTVRVRYYTWPDYEQVDTRVGRLNLSYVYKKAVDECGWPDLGGSDKREPVQLEVIGRGHVSAAGSDLYLDRRAEEIGGGCYIHGDGASLVGKQKGKWTFGQYDENERTKLIIKDGTGAVVFSERIPKKSGRIRDGNRWDAGEEAATVAWVNADEGSIELTNELSAYTYHRAMLHGFRELWRWGVENCEFRDLEETTN
ncbi:hypothetical protein ACFLRO_00990 [Bacteroidota bacterium]